MRLFSVRLCLPRAERSGYETRPDFGGPLLTPAAAERSAQLPSPELARSHRPRASAARIGQKGSHSPKRFPRGGGGVVRLRKPVRGRVRERSGLSPMGVLTTVSARALPPRSRPRRRAEPLLPPRSRPRPPQASRRRDLRRPGAGGRGGDRAHVTEAGEGRGGRPRRGLCRAAAGQCGAAAAVAAARRGMWSGQAPGR